MRLLTFVHAYAKLKPELGQRQTMSKVKIFICILATAFAVGFLAPKNASAAAVEVNTLGELAELFANGGEAKLGADITLDNNRAVSSPLTLDLNGHTLDVDAYTLVVRSSLTLMDSVGNGEIVGDNDTFVVQIGDSTHSGAMTLESGKISGTTYGVRVYSGSLTINGGHIFAPAYAVYNDDTVTMNDGLIEATAVDNDPAMRNNGGAQFEMNGGQIVALGDGVGLANSFDYGENGEGTGIGSTAVINGGEISAINNGGSAVTAYKNSSVTINGGTLISDSTALISNGSISGRSEGTNAKFTITGGNVISNNGPAIYAPQPNGETNISGGTIRGDESAIEIRAGSLNITGGTLISTATTYVVNSNSNGSTTIGAAVAIAQHNTRLPITTHICGGHFQAVTPFSIANPQGNDEESAALVSAYIDQPCGELFFESTGDSSIQVQNMPNESFVSGGTYTYSVVDYLADGYGEREENGLFVVGRVYDLTTTTTRGGGVAVSQTRAFAGDTINIDTDANLAFELKTLSATGDDSGTSAAITNNSFTMPAEDVTVAASFGFIPSPEPQAAVLPDPQPGPDSIPVERQNAKPAAIITIKEKESAEEPEEEDVPVSPNTSDDLATYIALLAICGGGLIAVVPKPRKN